MRNLILLAALGIGFGTAGAAADAPKPVSGTFKKGPADGPQPELPSWKNNYTMTILQERAVGSVDGGIFTGSADFFTLNEFLDFKKGTGTFKMDIRIKKTNGALIVITLDGSTEGVTATAKSVPVHGTWKIRSAKGADAGLKGEGKFEGTEDFDSGVTTGTFSGSTYRS